MPKTKSSSQARVEVAESNVLRAEDTPVHGWYRFVLSYPPHLVRKYAEMFGLGEKSLLLDTFCGTGTTLVEAKKLGIPSLGCDAHPFATMVSQVKTNWALDPALMIKLGGKIATKAENRMEVNGLAALSFDARMLSEGSLDHWRQYQLTEDEKVVLPTGFMSERPPRPLAHSARMLE